MFKFQTKNPITVFAKWFLFKHYFEWKYRHKNLSIGYLANFSNTSFGVFNKIYDDAILTNCVLGDFSFVGQKTRISNAYIGNFCSIASEVLIGLGKHPSKDFVSTHPIFYSPLAQAQLTFSKKSYFRESIPVKIGHDVWIGARALVLDGITIGNGVIVAAGAVVTKDVPSYAIVAGVPAKVIRYRFNPHQILLLEKLKWWNKNIEWLRKNHKKFLNISYLIT